MEAEEILGVWLESSEIQLRLPLTLRLVLDYLAKHRWVAQSAAQIEAGMRTDPFYLRHGKRSRSSKKMTRRISRSGIKTYVARIRAALQLAFDEAGIDLKVEDILISERTVSNEVGYRLRARVRFVHLQ